MRPVPAHVSACRGVLARPTPLAALVVGSLLAGCSSASTSSSASSATRVAVSTPQATTTESSIVPTPTPAPTFAAPLMIQVENAPDSRPQSGIGDADLVYEYETEGGISRFSTLFFHQPAGAVGPVRSSRLATLALLRIYTPVLLYSGASQYVIRLLQSSGLQEYNEDTSGGALFRIGWRAPPHNLYTDGGQASGLLNRVHPTPVTYQLWPRTALDALPAGGTAGGHVTVPVSNEERPSFTWHPELGGYTRSEPTGALIDADTGKPVVASTLVVLQVPVRLGPEVEDVSGARGLDVTVTGSGAAQVFTGGFQFSGTFNQPASGPPTLTTGSGAPAPIAPGLVWIMLVRRGSAATAG